MTISTTPSSGANRRRAALITGSSRNIGRAIALALARANHDVLIHARSNHEAAEATASEAAALGARTAVALGDLGDANDVADIARTAIEAFGCVDVLVNNAAIRPARGFLELTEADWDAVLDVNLRATVRLCAACAPAMVERGFGRIINFTGMNAIHGYAGRAPVSVSKHAIWGLTKALAKELGPQGVTVNAVSPGPIETAHPDDPEMAAHIHSQLSKIPLGRLGRPDEIGALVAFLASDPGGFVSGQMIAANGAAQT